MEAYPSLLGLDTRERDRVQSLMEALGGPGSMATAMRKADEGNVDELAEVGNAYGLDMTAVPEQTPVSQVTPTPPGARPEPEHTTAPTPTQEVEETLSRWSGVPITPEDRSSEYDPGDYPYSLSVELRIVNTQGGIYDPYTGTWFESIKETDIEHIAARPDAYDSGLCAASPETRSEFAFDLMNLTLTSPCVDRHQKSDNAAPEWLLDLNQCWYANCIVQIRLEYGLTNDRTEAQAITAVLGTCDSIDMVILPPETRKSSTTTPRLQR